MHLAGELADRGLDERLAVAGRAAEVDLQHRISAVGQQAARPASIPPASRAHGPPCTSSTSGRPFGSTPTGRVRYECRSSPSRAVIVTGVIGASASGSRCGYGRNSSRLSPVRMVVEIGEAGVAIVGEADDPALPALVGGEGAEITVGQLLQVRQHVGEMRVEWRGSPAAHRDIAPRAVPRCAG